MKTDMQLRVQAYLDNELSPSDARKIATWISSDPEARDLYNELKDTREILAHNEPAVKLPESREFYWSKIERGIAVAERLPAVSQDRPWWARFLAPVAGTVALCALLLSVADRGGRNIELSQSEGSSGPIHRFEESPDVSTITFRSEAEGVTVVWLSTQ